MEIKYQLLKVKVSDARDNIKFSADTDKKYKKLTGIFASLPDSEAALESTLELKVSDVEVFPEDFEIKMLSCGENVAPNDRFYTKLEHEAAGSRIDVRYTDGGSADGYPYTLLLYLRLEDKI